MADDLLNGANGLAAPDVRIPPTGQADTVVRPWDARNSAYGGPGSLVLMLAQEADEIPAWGTHIIERDRKLREFWPSENYFASALSSIAKKYSSFKFELDGPARMTNIERRLMHNWEHGKGIKALLGKIIIDQSSQDNGAFAEVVRIEDDPRSPVIQLNHLDAGRCRRTGDYDQPVMYWDRVGVPHLLNWYQVMTFEDLESPIEAGRGIGYCTLTRVLRECQIARDFGIFTKEKVGGRWTRTIHLVNGVGKDDIKNAMDLSEEEADAMLLMRYKLPLILTTIDPTTPISHQEIQLASLPENFDEEVHKKWYLTLLAMTFGVDYTEFAPMMSGHLGSGQQSQTMATKARGKGPADFMADIESKFNFHGIMPPNVNFVYDEQDEVEENQQRMLDWRLAQVMNLLVDPKSGEPIIDAQTARQILRDKGFLRAEYLHAMGETEIRPAPVEAYIKEQGPSYSAQYDGPLSVVARMRLKNLGLEPYQPAIHVVPNVPDMQASEKSKGKVYFVRHGETKLNALHRIRGWSEAPLDNQGKEEAQDLAGKLKNKIQLVISSDLKRAAETAQIIAQRAGVPVLYSEGLRTWNLGRFNGTDSHSIEDTYEQKPDEKVPGGESFNEFKTRYVGAVKELLDEYKKKDVALVSHNKGFKLLLNEPDGVEPGSYEVVPTKDLLAEAGAARG